MKGSNEEGFVELIDLAVLLRRFRFFLAWSKADVLPGSRCNEPGRNYDVAASVFDDVVSAFRGSPESGKPGFPTGVDLGIGSKIQVLQHVDCGDKNPGAD